MASSIQRRRGTTSDHATFTGAVGEITIDTTKDTVVVHDGAVVGGVPLLREDGSNSSLALGSQGVPSLKFSGDPNTGIYSPGADQLAVATNGTGRLFVGASGNVGVGSASAGSTFRSVGLTGASIIEAFGADVDGFADLEIKSNGASGASRLYFSDTAAQSGLIRYSHNTNSLEFSTAGSERLRITSTGTLNFKGAGTAGSTQAVSFDGSAPVNSLVIDSSGRLGIGTSDVRGTLGLQHGNTSPQGLNDVAIDALRISQGAGGIVAIRTTQYDAANQPAAGDTQFFNLYYNGSTYNYYERMRIRADGCVGIGTTPASGTTLHVDATGGATVRVSRISASAGAYGQLEHDGTNTTLTSTAATAFVNNGTEKARIRSDGMFEVKGAGVAGSSPAFSVNGSAPANSAIIDTSGRLLVGTTSDANGGQVEAKTAMVVSGNPAYDKKAFIAQIPYATTNITSSLLAGFDGNIHGVDLGYRYNGTGYDLCFATNSTISGSPTERVSIDSTGVLQTTNGVQLNKSGSVVNNVKLVRTTGDGGGNTVQVYWNISFGADMAGGCLGGYQNGVYKSPGTTVTNSHQVAIYGFIST